MRLTSKGRYAVTAILDIAIHQENGLVSVKDIAKRQNISESYLEQLLGRLRQAGLVSSQRGPGGVRRVLVLLHALEVTAPASGGIPFLVTILSAQGARNE